MTAPHPLRRLASWAPHNGAHRVAIRAGISIAVPLLVLFAIDRLDLSLYATFGAFTALYGRQHTHLSRARMQVSAGIVLVASVTLGAAIGSLPGREWIIVPVVAIAAAGTAFLSDALNWHPPGPLFVVFALAACASVATEPAVIPVALLLAAASAAFALLVGTAGIARPSSRVRTPIPWSVSFRAAAHRPGQLATALRFGIGTLVAGAIPTATGLGHPYWAMVAVVAALSGADAAARLVRAGQRILGTFLGIGLAALLFALDLPALGVIIAAVALQMVAELFVLRNYGLTVVFVTPLALLMVQLAHAVDAPVLLRDRLIETVIGAAVGVVVTLVAGRLGSRRARPPEVAP